MNFISKHVTHKKFGKGRVVDLSDSIIEINFLLGNKKFVFPDAFGTYLMMVDQKAGEIVKKMKQKRKEEQIQVEIEHNREIALIYEENQRQLKREKILKSIKIHPSAQATFWCKEEEENKILTEWKAFTGITKSGNSKGQIRKLIRLNQNSACLFTGRDSKTPEKNRTILGVFMVNEDFIGKLCNDGYISAHPKYRIRLSEKESKKLLFWNYYVNEKYPQRMTWNAGDWRYLDNIWIAQILRDIISLKKEKTEKELVQQFFEYFCDMNKINKNELPKPNGVLMRT